MAIEAHMEAGAEILAAAVATGPDPDEEVRMLERTRGQAANLNGLDASAYDDAIALVRRAIALDRHVPAVDDRQLALEPAPVS